ncbi:MAG: serine/threonine-protein kinase [Myxococcaceae bacterium]
MPADGTPANRNPTDPSLGPALELLGQNVGGYVVEALLGVGGMGLVYQAKLSVIARKFAIKVLRPEAAQDPVVAANFIREAQTLSQLKHPHIIDIVGFGQLDEKRQYMVMEFLEGKTLADELEEKGALLPSRALELADDMLDALEAAHSVEVIHRDLKPGNVFLAKVSGGTEVLKLLDFGLAKQQPVELAENTVSEAGKSVVAGTPEYIAPEQARGLGARKHSDLYSFGVMLYEMLTGHQPFEVGPDSADRVVDSAPRPPPRAGAQAVEAQLAHLPLRARRAGRRPAQQEPRRAAVERLGGAGPAAQGAAPVPGGVDPAGRRPPDGGRDVDRHRRPASADPDGGRAKARHRRPDSRPADDDAPRAPVGHRPRARSLRETPFTRPVVDRVCRDRDRRAGAGRLAFAPA